MNVQRIVHIEMRNTKQLIQIVAFHIYHNLVLADSIMASNSCFNAVFIIPLWRSKLLSKLGKENDAMILPPCIGNLFLAASNTLMAPRGPGEVASNRMFLCSNSFIFKRDVQSNKFLKATV